jgi:Carboxypeptidase regulatory-like domain
MLAGVEERVLDDVDARLTEWARSVVDIDSDSVSLARPVSQAEGSGVGLYLLEVAPKRWGRADPRPRHELTGRYLVTTWDEDPPKAHARLAKLLFAALERTDVEVEAEPPSHETWSAFGVPPQPSFVVRVPVHKDRAYPETKLVLKPLVVETQPIEGVHGRVLSPDDVPLTGARVALPELDTWTLTDEEGRFRFPAVPLNGSHRVIAVNAKGAQRLFELNGGSTQEDPLLLRFDPREG